MIRGKKPKKHKLKKKLISLFFIALFANFLGPIIDPDFPFHLKTGEYIYQHKEIPKDDPFSFYGEGITTDRESFTLSQYWISQVIFYKLYSGIGPSGIILLRAAVFSAFVFLLWFALRKRGLYSSLIVAILVTIELQSFKLDRPQIFSFLFMLILILLLERFREKPESTISLYFIPPLMLLWANMHAGFVFGIAVILIYSLSEALKYFVNKPAFIGRPFPKKSALLFLLIILLAILFSYINPVTNNQMLTALESHTDANWLYKDNREYMSPIEEMGVYYAAGASAVTFFVLFGFVSIVVVLNTVRTKSIDLTIFTLIVFSSVAAFTAVRYIPFFVAVALPLSKNCKFFTNINLLGRLKDSVITYVIFLVFFVLAIGFGFKEHHNMFKVGQSIYPEGAANFLLNNLLEANMFNQHNRGSYLIWRLYPHYKVFNDTRYISLEAALDSAVISHALDDYAQPYNLGLANALSVTVPEELGKIKMLSIDYNPQNNRHLWKKLLDQYNIDLIVHEACSDYKKDLYPLTLRLLKDEDWVLIYLDGTMQIFVRNKEKYSNIIKKFKLPKELIYNEIILETIPLVSNKVTISTPYSSLAFALMMKGKDQYASKMINAALELDDKDLVANFCKAYLALKQKYGINSAHVFKQASYVTK